MGLKEMVRAIHTTTHTQSDSLHMYVTDIVPTREYRRKAEAEAEAEVASNIYVLRMRVFVLDVCSLVAHPKLPDASEE